jgi:DNA-binding NtrC family response regulator
MTQAANADILIVDDEPDLRELYMLSLVHEGYACDTAGSVAQARALLGTRTYRAVIVDMRMPDGTGLDILREMQLMKRNERVIVATAYGSADNAVLEQARGCSPVAHRDSLGANGLCGQSRGSQSSSQGIGGRCHSLRNLC